MNEYLEIGQIVAPQALKGEVRVMPWCDNADFMLQFKSFYFDEGKAKIKVEKARAQKNIVVLKLEGIDGPDEANKLRGKVLYIKRKDVKLEEGNYFVQDLIGMKVVDADDESIFYGEISEISPTGANDVYHIVKDEKTVLIPAIKQVIIETNIKNNIMRIRPLEGLFDND